MIINAFMKKLLKHMPCSPAISPIESLKIFQRLRHPYTLSLKILCIISLKIALPPNFLILHQSLAFCNLLHIIFSTRT